MYILYNIQYMYNIILNIIYVLMLLVISIY